jgi:hypothetical protein
MARPVLTRAAPDDDQQSRLMGALPRSRRLAPAPALSSLGRRGSRVGVTAPGVEQPCRPPTTVATRRNGRRCGRSSPTRRTACDRMGDIPVVWVCASAWPHWLAPPPRCSGRANDAPRRSVRVAGAVAAARDDRYGMQGTRRRVPRCVTSLAYDQAWVLSGADRPRWRPARQLPGFQPHVDDRGACDVDCAPLRRQRVGGRYVG